VCNNAEITPEGLRGQPTEGALLAAAAKVILYLSSCLFVCFFSFLFVCFVVCVFFN
jgi:hypothetical protein